MTDDLRDTLREQIADAIETETWAATPSQVDRVAALVAGRERELRARIEALPVYAGNEAQYRADVLAVFDG